MLLCQHRVQRGRRCIRDACNSIAFATYIRPRFRTQSRCYAQAASKGAVSSRDGSSVLKEARPRFNPVGVQQLSDGIHQQVFPGLKPDPPQYLVDLSREHLSRHGLHGKNQKGAHPIAFDLPPLQGADVEEHFHKLGKYCSEPFYSLAAKYVRVELPRPPRRWVQQSGWTRYYPDGTYEAVSAPGEAMLTFDTEVMWRESNFAVMACAASDTSWYAWISPWLLGESENDRHLIPLGDAHVERVIVGHNIGYDRARVLEEYDIKQSRNFFLDTMSLHVAVNGMCSQQRPTWMKHQKSRDNREKYEQAANDNKSMELAVLLEKGSFTEEEEELWVGRSSVNSLRDVAKFHCNVTIDKARRDDFGELDRPGVRERLDELLDYCAADVSITHRVFKKVFPAFLEVCPHPVSFGALRHLSSVILPINETWAQYIDNAEQTYRKLSKAVEGRLKDLADRANTMRSEPEKFVNDPWLRQLDWSGQEVRMVKPKKKGEKSRPAARQKKPGMPRWYKDLFATNDSEMVLTVKTRIAPLLLRLSWDGYPLVWSDKYGWTFKVPNQNSGTYDLSAVVKCDMSDEKTPSLRDDLDHRYFKLPHKDGPQARCASPMAKSYLQYFEKGTLTSEYHHAKEALEMNASCSYWISARDRICSQMDVYARDFRRPAPNSLPKPLAEPQSDTLGFILPQVIPMGTITRRAVENTWLTASNAKVNRVGSELKSMITAPNGYSFVGADVDSQELWIASLVGDAQFQLHGGNAIGFMTLEGTKSAGTDLHSKTAKILGISRNDAKVFNYGRIYGAGQKFAATLLRQFNANTSERETQDTAARLYLETKGTRTLRKLLHSRSFWRGGTESFVFNQLEDFAEQDQPRTPALGAGITEALLRRYISKGAFMTSRINWAIQSSGVDYLHLLIISMDYLIRTYNIQARLAITVHDEIRYMVKNEDRYRCALALQISNVWTRAMFSQRLGINDLPQSCAYFSAVDVDHVLRKEVDMDCVTPSHPSKIPAGESLTIMELLNKGRSARLDATDSSKLPNLDHFDYQPRPKVTEQLVKTSRQGYIQAQISQTPEELAEIIKRMQPKIPSPNKHAVNPRTRPKKHTSAPMSQPQEPKLLDVPYNYERWRDLKDENHSKPWLPRIPLKPALQDSVG